MIERHAGQVLVAGFPGREPPRELTRWAEQGLLGGFILFRRNIGDLAALVELNHALLAAFPAELPPFLTVDQEGGRVARLSAPVLQLPSMQSLASQGDLELTRRAARVLSEQLRELGFNLNMAPVLDVHTNPANPVIGDRSFGGTVAEVVAQARAVAQGMADAGLGSCGKHFPGHGDTHLDSHLALPRVQHDRLRLEQVEMGPFMALAAELPALMTAHVVYDALDPTRPATLSRPIATELLRGKVGFTGVLFSDDMEMRAIADGYPPGEAGCEAIAAGCDTLLVCSNMEQVMEVHAALVKRAGADSRFAARLQEAAERSLQMRRRFVPRVACVGDPSERFVRNGEALQARLAAL